MTLREELRRRATKVVRDIASRGPAEQARRSRAEARSTALHNKARTLQAEARKAGGGQPQTASEREYFVDEYPERRGP
jgi:hypothetical protein